jgi:UDP-glucose 4-epimerase
MHVLVTGGAGFIGSHLVRGLERAGHTVRVLDNLSTGKPQNLAGTQADLVSGDLLDVKAVSASVSGVQAVFHLAALGSVARSVEAPEISNSINVGGTLNVLNAARAAGVKRVIYASSSSVYGDTPTLPKHEEMTPSPSSPYGVSKLAAELYCRVFAGVYGMETISLRYFNVFGPRQDPQSLYAAVVPRFTTRMLAGQSPVVFGDGEQTRDFTYVDNVVQANLLALNATRGFGQAMNVAAGGRVSLNDLFSRLKPLTGYKGGAEYRERRAGDIRDSYAAIDKARDLIGYGPVVSFEEGLSRTVAWYRNGADADG